MEYKLPIQYHKQKKIQQKLDMSYMKHIKQQKLFLFLRTSPICFLLFINKVCILVFYFYWKHFMPRIPSKRIIFVVQKVKNLLVNAGHIGSIPELRRSPGGGNGNSLQHSCLGNPRNRGAGWVKGHGVTKIVATQQLNH